MATQPDTLQKILLYANNVQDPEAVPDETTSSAAQAAHEARLSKTVAELQKRVQEQQAALEKLRASSASSSSTQPSPDPAVRLRQLRMIQKAYESLTPVEPTLPPAESSLPVLLAIRNTQSLIAETKTSITTVQEKFTQAKTRLEQEEADLHDAHLITYALEKRIDKLRAQKDDRSQKSPDQVAKELIQQRKSRKKTYDLETRRLIRALNDFIDEQLAAMLAAEELGGPVVGDMVDVKDEILGAGFTQKGKAKKLKNVSSLDDKKRQRRIDEIWGPKDNEDGELNNSRGEKDAAGAEMRALTEDLLNVAVDEGPTSAYVELQRDSAAARFLVRAKVAQFHPKDAKKLRLIDFGRELAD